MKQHFVSAMIGAVVGTVCAAGLAWLWLAQRPAPLPQPDALQPVPMEVPSTDAPPETSEDVTTTPPENAPSEPDPQMRAAIQQTLDVHRQSLEAMADTVRLAHDAALDARRELSTLTSRAGHLHGTLGGIGRSIPRVRQEHTTAVQRLTDLANNREDRATADQLWRDLGQFEAGLAQMEAQTGVWLLTADEVVAALRQWDATVAGWATELAGLQQTRSQLLVEVASLQTLTAWDSRLDVMPTEIAQVNGRLTELQQALAGLRPDLDARLSTTHDGEQFVKSWEDFRAQWQHYLSSY